MSGQMLAVFTIVDYSNSAVIEKIYAEEKVPVALSTHGHGAADSSVLEYLGFGENKKSVSICPVSEAGHSCEPSRFRLSQTTSA